MIPEEKIIEKMRRVLVADPILNAYVRNRVYCSHPSTINEPQFPAMSIHLLNSSPAFRNAVFMLITLQLDTWLPASNYDGSDLMKIQGRIREVMNAQFLTDGNIPIVVAESQELSSGPYLVEEDTGLLHLPTIYRMVIK